MLKAQVVEFDRRIMAWHRSNATSRRLDDIPGVGPALATALVAGVADPKAFRSARHFAAWVADLAVTCAEGPSVVANHGFTTGQIGLGGFEKLLSPSAMKIGIDHGIGCYADKLPEDERTKAVIPDQFRHEIATAFNLKGRGLVVLTSAVFGV